MTKVEVEWTIPLQLINRIIYTGLNTTLNNTTLYVPPGTKTLYEKAPIWRNFTVVIERGVMVTGGTAIDDIDKDKISIYNIPDGIGIITTETTPIDDIDKDKIAIYNIPDGIGIATTEATPISIFNVTGQKVHQSVVTGSAEIHLNKGVYIVKANNGSRKVLVM